MADVQPNPVDEILKGAIDPRAKQMELLKRVKLTREHALYSRGRVQSGRAEKHYVWVNTNEHRQIDFQSTGYALVRDDDKVKTQWLQPDGTHRRGDLILYSIDKDMHEAIKMDDQLRAYESIDAPKHAFASHVQKVGGGVAYEPTPR